MSEQNKRVTRAVLTERFAEGNLDAADVLIHPDFITTNSRRQPARCRGPEQTVSWLRGLWGDMRAEIKDEICEGDEVVARVIMHGHHVGEFLGKPPTGKQFAAQQIHIWRLRDGKVIEHWSCRDALGQALQLGLVGD